MEWNNMLAINTITRLLRYKVGSLPLISTVEHKV